MEPKKNLNECDKRKSRTSSKLHMVCVSSNNVRHPVTKTFTTIHPTTLHSTSLHLWVHFATLVLHYTCFHFTTWKWSHYDLSKRRVPQSQQHGVTSQKNCIFSNNTNITRLSCVKLLFTHNFLLPPPTHPLIVIEEKYKHTLWTGAIIFYIINLFLKHLSSHVSRP